MSEHNKEQASIPSATLEPHRRVSWAWLLPAAALLLALWLGYESWCRSGVIVTVQLEQGFGLSVGDEVRYRGIAVGEVRSVDLTEDLSSVLVRVALLQEAEDIARSGAKFWVVRAQISLTGLSGLDTLVGPRYLAVLPGYGPKRRHFIGLPEPPVVESIEPGDLEIILHTASRGGLRPASPVMYRQVAVGVVLSVGLASDGGSVEARVHIPKAYAQLVRSNTKFWPVGGLSADLGISGLSLEVDSLESFLSGGVAMATPPSGGEVVSTGHRFPLYAEPEEDWHEWQPLAAIGSSLLPPGSAMPSPMRAVAAWKKSGWIRWSKSRRGWVLQTTRGLLGPIDLLCPQPSGAEEQALLEVAGLRFALSGKAIRESKRLALIDISTSTKPWPASLQRVASEEEDCLIVADPARRPLPLARARLTSEEGGRCWRIDPAVPIDEHWHGACVIARSDGALIGMVCLEDGGAFVALLPKGLSSEESSP